MIKKETKAAETEVKGEISTKDELLVLDDLKVINNTPEHVFLGVCAKNNWHSGKAVSEKEYKDAVEAFLKSPMNGGKKTC